jgi:hypothetical protein
MASPKRRAERSTLKYLNSTQSYNSLNEYLASRSGMCLLKQTFKAVYKKTF